MGTNFVDFAAFEYEGAVDLLELEVSERRMRVKR
jgi:hypothetical protein